MLSVNEIISALNGVIDPNTHKKLEVTDENSQLQLKDKQLDLGLTLGYPLNDREGAFRSRIQEALSPLGVELASLKFGLDIKKHAVQGELRPLENVKNIIAVASGKGGVGKSTTSVNLALALQQQGARVGLLDADIYGPSVPTMLGLNERPRNIDNKMMAPVENHGLQANSIAFLIGEDAPANRRGPMVTQALTQLLTQTAWDNLDYLIIDMPPGTGDIALTMAQKVPLTGAVVVTTPQDLALIDARRGLAMFQKVDV